MYVCGPTVYDYCHIGHARSYVVFDTLRRFLSACGYSVKVVQNFTDIEDSILHTAKKMGIPYQDVSSRFIKEFFIDMDALGIKRANSYPRVTENIPEIIEMVKAFLEGGCAYKSKDGIYFDAARCGASIDKIKDRVVEFPPPDPHKKDPMDFLIWKRCNREPCWDTPWGKGRPGWHIECTVMATKYLGLNLDIHGGGVDLIFPHHTYERMLAQEFYGTELARIYMHNGFIFNEGKTMSKSLGNTIKIRDLMKRRTRDQIRFFLLGAHYRENLAYTEEKMEHEAERYNSLVRHISGLTPGNSIRVDDVEEVQSGFMRSLAMDFHTERATEMLFTLMEMGNTITPSAWRRLKTFLRCVEEIFGYKLITKEV